MDPGQEKEEKITKEMLDNLFKKFPRKYLQTVPKEAAIPIEKAAVKVQ